MNEGGQPERVSVEIAGEVSGLSVKVSLELRLNNLKESLAQILTELTEVGLASEEAGMIDREDKAKLEDRPPSDHSIGRLARELQVEEEGLQKVLGIKGESVQLVRASTFKVADAITAICFSYEKGVGRNGMSFETFSSLVSANQIKMKTPLPTVCYNLISSGYIEKKQYEDGKTILLTPQGEAKGAETLKNAISGKVRSRSAAGAARQQRRSSARGSRG